MLEHACLLADIGGTNARFALVHPSQARIDSVVALRCADFDGPLEAVRNYLDQCGIAPGTVKQAAFAVAATLTQETVKLTNSAWSFERDKLAQALGLARLELFNDFEALALSLPGLGTDDYQPIGTAKPGINLPMVAIGPGTGLGVAGVVPARHGWVAVAGEGGHATLAAADDFEAEILQAARRQFAHVSAERLLSGIGLPALLHAVCMVEGLAPVDLPAEEIGRLAETGRNAQCRTALALFFSFLGGFAGDLALAFGARGGVFIGGGIVPQLPNCLAGSRFRERFEAKGRFGPYMADIATVTITTPYATLRGLARALATTG